MGPLKNLLQKVPAITALVGHHNTDIILSMRDDGIIKDFYLNNRLLYAPGNFKHILNQNIRDYYRFPAHGSLKKLALNVTLNQGALFDMLSDSFEYESKNRFEHFNISLDFFTTMPFSSLFLRHARGAGLFGLVRFHSVVERLNALRLQPLLVLDGREKIQGINASFIKQFPGNRPFRDYLGVPVRQLLSESPLQLIQGKTKDYAAARAQKWKLKTSSDGWHWRPAKAGQGLLLIKEPQNLEKYDFKLEADLTVVRGGLPGLILAGEKTAEPLFPDYKGYLLGPDVTHKKFLIKKEGELVRAATFRDATASGIRVLMTFLKQQNRVACFLDNEFVAGLQDPDPIEKPGAFQYLYSRDLGEYIIHAVRIYILPKGKTGQTDFNEVSLKNGTQNTFRFHQLLDRMASAENDPYYGFLLYDISHLRKNIRTLKAAQASTAQERDRYKAMALEAEGGHNIMVGHTPTITRIRENARLAAASSATILVQGPTGTGKEVLAAYIHQQSLYRNGPFVKVDCSALPESLLESELFGFEKGAFTGALATRVGKLEAAKNGTLFLDEIGNLNTAIQAKLLRFLQDFELVRIGSNKKIKVDTRIIAASNRLLKELVAKARFRDDLYYRMNTIEFVLPPLCERKDDIPFLAAHFLGKYNKRLDRAIKGFSPASFRKMAEYGWPGNIRELENVVQKAVLFCQAETIQENMLDIAFLPPDKDAHRPMPDIPFGDARALRAEHVRALLEMNNGIAVRAARQARVSKATFFRKMKKYGIRS
jgi:two-component system response regulator AtoC